ncbi:MAG: hypothetical protein ACLTFZ_03390 [Lachnospiraceae bacterium]
MSVDDDRILSVSDDGRGLSRVLEVRRLQFLFLNLRTIAATSLTVEVTVNKRAYTVDSINKKYLYSRENEDSIDL